MRLGDSGRNKAFAYLSSARRLVGVGSDWSKLHSEAPHVAAVEYQGPKRAAIETKMRAKGVSSHIPDRLRYHRPLLQSS